MNRHLHCGIIVLALAATAPTFAQAPPGAPVVDPADFRAILDEKMPGLLQDNLTPGAAVVLVKDGKTAWIAGYGHADVASGREVTADTAFNIGSISKTVAAWGVMKLVEEGRIDLDAPVESYLTRWHLPESDFDHGGVTMRRLLSHTAGLSLSGYRGFPPSAELPTIEQSLAGHTNSSGDVRVIMPPGTQWRYAGGGYTLAQLIIEEVSGTDFVTYMEREVLQPLGMTNSAYAWPERIESIAATSYNEMAKATPGPRFTALAAAGMQTTARDMATFVEASLNPTLLSEETLGLMQQPANDASPNYGLGYSVAQLMPGITHVGHGGANTVWMANIGMILETGDGLVVLTNAAYGANVIGQVRCAWRDWLMQIETPCRGAIGPLVISTALREGGPAAVARFRNLWRDDPEGYDFGENQLNQAGYALAGEGRLDDALALLELNVELYPDAWNPWDSLGEVSMRSGNVKRAIECYEKSLELNPDNTNGAAMLERLKEMMADQHP